MIKQLSRGDDRLANPYEVALFESDADDEPIIFECMADDFDDAIEQAREAYPFGVVINVTLVEQLEDDHEDPDAGAPDDDAPGGGYDY